MNKPQSISNDLVNVQVELKLFEELMALIDEYRNGTITIPQVLGVLSLVHDKILHDDD